ncbi:hypothetical protein J3E68DRAFT_431187 [Trichoderma sp. SZMC 28012]
MVAVHLGILGTPSKKCRLDASADPIQELRNACQGVTKGPMLISATFPENFLWQDRPRPDSKSTPYGTEDIEWSCSASLFEEFKLGSTDVICEGYASSDDPSHKGEKRYPDVANPNGHWSSDGEGGTDLGAWAFAVIFFAVLKWILYSGYLA